MNEQTALQEAIEKLYMVFADYPLRIPMDACSCCMPQTEQERLAAQPLRQLHGYDLIRYTYNALYTCGDVDDFRHFLPRILELLCNPQERRSLPDLFIVFSKFPYGHWETWPAQEQHAITNYLLVWWREILACGESTGLEASTYLEELLDAHINCTPFLHIWQATHTPSALYQLAQFIRYRAWNKRISQYPAIKDWLCEAATKEALEQGFYACIDESWSEELAYAVEVLEWLGNA